MNVFSSEQLATALLAIGIPLSSWSGQFFVQCSYKNANLQECAAQVSDLVTDKFTTKFPADKFAIFVHSDIHRYTNGGFAAYAVAGVVRKGSGEFPLSRYSSTLMSGTEKMNGVDLAQAELRNFRAVVEQLMSECEVSPACDVYTPRRP